MWQSASVAPSQKVDEIPSSLQKKDRIKLV